MDASESVTAAYAAGKTGENAAIPTASAADETPRCEARNPTAARTSAEADFDTSVAREEMPQAEA